MSAKMESKEKIIIGEKIKKYYTITSGSFKGLKQVVKAVDGVNLHIFKGETLGLVGESGCGKSTLGRVLINLEKPSFGKVLYNQKDISTKSQKEMNPLRKKLQIIFQDPYSSLNARHTVGRIIREGLRIHKIGSKDEQNARVHELMHVVGLRDDAFSCYPHEFSGGQRQRIGIARALALDPELIICDEPVSALDVSIQAQVINLLLDLQTEFHLTYLFISHDLAVVRYISDRIAVMYLGKIVELSEKTDLYANPCHPYTKALLEAVPQTHAKNRKKPQELPGDIPSPINPPPGCRFHTRCIYAQEICSNEEPPLREMNSSHFAACHFAGSFQ